jgi:hypothetical protein
VAFFVPEVDLGNFLGNLQERVELSPVGKDKSPIPTAPLSNAIAYQEAKRKSVLINTAIGLKAELPLCKCRSLPSTRSGQNSLFVTNRPRALLCHDKTQ